MKGTNNSKPVREMVGSRIKSARLDKKLSRSALAELIMQNELCPSVTTRRNTSEIKTPVEALADRLKQWEYGNNPVDLEYIPAICKVLECDAGYLFAEYQEKFHIFSDLCSVTGLSEQAVYALLNLQNGESANLVFIDYLLCSTDLPKLLEIASDHSFCQVALSAAEKNRFKTQDLEEGFQEQAELAEYRAFKITLDIIRKFSALLNENYLRRSTQNG